MISIVSVFHLAIQYPIHMNLFSSDIEIIPALSFQGFKIVETIMVLILQFTFTLVAFCERINFEEIEESFSPKTKEPTMIDKIIYAVLYFSTVLLLWIWIIFYFGHAGLILMAWIFYSILEENIIKIKKLTKYLLLPTLVTSLLVIYAFELFASDNSKAVRFFVAINYAKIQIGIMFFTIFIVAFYYKCSQQIPEKLAFSSTVHGAVFTALFKKMYIFSLTVLFLIGLSDINLLHTGLMILCLFFMINHVILKQYWICLVVYTMGMLSIRYLWQFLEQFITIEGDAVKVLEIIGLPKSINSTQNSSNLIDIPYDYLIWILLLSASIQHLSNKIVLQESYTNHFLVKGYIYIYDYFSHIEIWIMYSTIIIIQYVASVNGLNLIRLLITFAVMFKHLYEAYNKIYYNYKEVYKYLVVLEAYSGILLAIRYIYQFLSFVPNAEHLEFPNLGFQIYNKKELYASTASDCILLLTSVLASRNCYRLRKMKSAGINQYDIDKKHKIFYKYFSNPFQYIVVISIYAIAIFEKLSISMLINITAIGFYEIFIANYFTKGKQDREKEWQARAILWKILYVNTILSLVLAYTRFILNTQFIPEQLFSYLEWIFFISGFTKGNNSDLALFHSYQYVIIFTLLIMERHSLQYIFPPSLQNRGKGWNINLTDNTPKPELNGTSLKKKMDFIRALTLLKAIAEALVPVLMLLLAFQKITIISVFYVILVLLGFCSSNLSNTRFLYIVLILLSIMQYAFILSNISSETSIYMPSSEPPFPIPWFKSDEFDAVEGVYFLNLGTNLKQLYSIFYDMLTQIFILIYYFYLSYREKQLGELEILNKQFDDTIIIKIPDQSIETKEYFLKALKECLIFVKLFFYQFSRYLIVGIALLFITQSLGILSAFYCVFCLVFIMKENDIYLLKSIKPYLQLLTSFLRFLVLDLTLQILIQLPFTYVKDQNFKDWCQYAGLMKIVGRNSEDIEHRYLTILFKVYTLFIVLIVYRMMKSKDYEEYINTVFSELERTSKNIAEEMTENFNNKRIKMNQFYSQSKDRFQVELGKLEENIVIWNKKYQYKKANALHKATSDVIDYKEEKYTSPKNKPKAPVIEKKEISFKYKLNAFLISLINRYLFKSFVDNITQPSHCNTNYEESKVLRTSIKALSLIQNSGLAKIDEKSRKSIINATQKKKKNELFDSEDSEDSDDSSDSDDSDDSENTDKLSDSDNSSFALNKTQELEQVNLNDNFENDEFEYDFHWKDYLKILIYVIASNTEALVYLSFFLNHWNYASLESIIFPLSVVGYSLIEYPRPPTKYFRYMLVYTETIFAIKFCIQLEVWETIFNKDWSSTYTDPWKTGFNLAKNTYSEDIIYYVLWDVVVMIALLLHNYYLIKVGLWKETERDIESLKQAKMRHRMINQPYYPIINRKPKKNMINRLLPRNKEEKPGKDYYFLTILIQMFILIYIFCFFTRMDGNSQDISQAIRSNQFQGRMVVSLIVQVGIIIIERYFYVNRSSQALKDAQEDEANQNESNKNNPNSLVPSRYRSSTSYSPNILPIRKNALRQSVDLNQLNTLLEKKAEEKKKKESERSLPLYVRLFIHIFLVISVHLIVFWYLPINGNIGSYGHLSCEDKNDADRCNNFEVNRYIQFFYLLYLIYLVFAALQIRESLPSFSKPTFPLMRDASQANYYFFKAYRSAPFLFEIRTLMDWIFTVTALNLFQWFKFEDIYSQLFLNQCYQKSLTYKDYGEKIPKFEKCYMGFCGLFIVLTIILLPLLIFSTLNPIITENPVVSSSHDIKFLYKNRAFNLYSISSSESISDVSYETWDNTYNFNSVSQLTTYDREQMSEILMPIYPDRIWDISRRNKEKLCGYLLIGVNDTNTRDFRIEFHHNFIRDYPASHKELKLSEEYTLDYNDIVAFNQSICAKNYSNITISNFFHQIIRLPSNGEKISPIIVEEKKFIIDIVLELVYVPEEGLYWKAQTFDKYNETIEITAFTISDKYSEITLNFSILTFYISIVYVLGAVIKYATIGIGMNVVMTDMKQTEHLQTLCEGVYISRMIGNLKKEEELYYELLDILRSPEITKMITGNSSIKEKSL